MGLSSLEAPSGPRIDFVCFQFALGPPPAGFFPREPLSAQWAGILQCGRHHLARAGADAEAPPSCLIRCGEVCVKST